MPITGSAAQGELRANRTDVGISFGGGESVSAGRALLFIEVLYSRGFRSMLKDVSAFGVKNVGVQLAAGVTFPLGHR